jgi:hypothetical protein
MALIAIAAVYYYWPEISHSAPISEWVGRGTNRVETQSARKPTPDTSPAHLPGAPLANAATNPPPEPRAETKPAIPEPQPKREPRVLRPIRNVLDAQIALARLGISVGPIDGAAGSNMQRALLAWQIHSGLPVSGELDEESKAKLAVEEPLFIDYLVTDQDLKRLMKIPPTWLGKSEAERLDYETILELVAERGRCSPDFVRRLNPKVNWTNVVAGASIKIPRIDPPVVREKAAFVRVHLYSKTLNVFGARTNLLAHFPCSIAAKVEKRPVGTLRVAKAAANPNYLFDPEVFSESPEARKINRKLVIPPGPNNPVGTAWIGLDKPGYGIHGTPKPEQVGRTESHGCFRLANWNAEHLLQMVWVGMPVIVEP